MRSLMLIAPLLLSGCNLFRSGLIEQTCEDLPRGCDGTIDTEIPDDTDDTAPWVPDNPFTLGTVLASAQDAELQLRVFDADGQLIQDAALDASEVTGAGPVAYDPDQPRIMLFDNDVGVLFVVADGATPVRVSATAELGWVYDMVVVDSVLFLVSANAIWGYQPGGDSLELLGTIAGLAQIQGVFSAFDDNLFLLNWASDNTPDLYRFTISTGENRLSYEGYDDGVGRSASGFQGPSAKPYVCSSVGGVYAVEDLQGGDHVPAAFPSQDLLVEAIGVELLSSVTDCDWDEGAERFLLHSADYGLMAMDEWGRVEPMMIPPTGEQFVRASFFFVEQPDAR